MKAMLDGMISSLEEMIARLDEFTSERRDVEGNKSERWADGEKGSAYVELTDKLEAAKESLEGAKDELEECKTGG